MKRVVFALLGMIGILNWSGCSALQVARQNWAATRTEHFQLLTNLEAGRAVELARQIERFRLLVEKLSGQSIAPAATATTIVIFKDRQSFKSFSPARDYIGYFIPTLWGNFVVACLDSRHGVRTLWHEYTHSLLQESRSLYPRWYNEGLAEMLSTVKFAGVIAEVGRIPVRIGHYLLASGTGLGTTGSNIKHRARRATKIEVDYALNWVKVYYLLLGHLSGAARHDRHRQLPRFLAAINQGLPERQAFTRVLGVTPEQFTREVLDYFRHGELFLARVSLGPDDAERVVPVRRLGLVATATKLGELALALRKYRAAGDLFAAALEEEPDQPRALAGLALVRQHNQQGREARRLMEQALREVPGDAFLHARYAELLRRQGSDAARIEADIKMTEGKVAGQGPVFRLVVKQDLNDKQRDLLARARQHAERALQLRADYLPALTVLGMLCLWTGQQPEKALSYLQAAYSQAPNNQQVLLGLALASLQAGRHRDFCRHLNRARLLLPPEEMGGDARDLEKLLRVVEQFCTGDGGDT